MCVRIWLLFVADLATNTFDTFNYHVMSNIPVLKIGRSDAPNVTSMLTGRKSDGTII